MTLASGLLKRAARCASATARPTALQMPWPSGPVLFVFVGWLVDWGYRRRVLVRLVCWVWGKQTAVQANTAATQAKGKATAPPGRAAGGSLQRSARAAAALTGRDLHAGGQEVLGVARGRAVPLAEVLDVVHLLWGGLRDRGREAEIRLFALVAHAASAASPPLSSPRNTHAMGARSVWRACICMCSPRRCQSRTGAAARTAASSRGQPTGRSGRWCVVCMVGVQRDAMVISGAYGVHAACVSTPKHVIAAKVANGRGCALETGLARPHGRCQRESKAAAAAAACGVLMLLALLFLCCLLLSSPLPLPHTHIPLGTHRLIHLGSLGLYFIASLKST